MGRGSHLACLVLARSTAPMFFVITVTDTVNNKTKANSFSTSSYEARGRRCPRAPRHLQPPRLWPAQLVEALTHHAPGGAQLAAAAQRQGPRGHQRRRPHHGVRRAAAAKNGAEAGAARVVAPLRVARVATATARRAHLGAHEGEGRAGKQSMPLKRYE